MRAQSRLRAGQVDPSPDLDRILSLPRREPGIAADALTEVLRTPEGAQRLRPAQALALYDIAQHKGLVGPIKCGGGKTLVTLLAAQMLDCERPVLVVPASLKERTRRDAMALSRHWRVWLPRLLGYEELGRVSKEHELRTIKPDALILDEAHKAANLDAAVTRRLDRYVNEFKPPVIVLSGTLTGDDLMRTQHLARWALGAKSPYPLVRAECERWQKALYPTLGQGLNPGALYAFGDDPRVGFARWVRESLGVVGTDDIGCGASLEMSLWRPRLPDALLATIRQVQLEERRPDGVDLLDEFCGISSVMSQLALGFWYRWDPPAPADWLTARREWWRFVRDVLERHEPGLDTELQVRLAYPDEAREWMRLLPSFKPNSVPVWETQEIIEQAVAYIREHNAIAWTKYRAVGHAFEKLRVPYHGLNGLDANGRYVEQAQGPICASIRSCSTGANLQHYTHSLVLTPPAKAEPWEQMLSRTHREGQRADSVHWAVIRVPAIGYHTDVMYRVREQAEQLTLQGDQQRLSIATWLEV